MPRAQFSECGSPFVFPLPSSLLEVAWSPCEGTIAVLCAVRSRLLPDLIFQRRIRAEAT